LVIAGIGLLALLYWLGRRKSFVADKADRVGRREIDPPQLNEAVIVRERQRESVAPIVLPQVNLDDLPEVRIGAAASIPVVDKLSMHEALSTAALERLAITQPIPPLTESPARSHVTAPPAIVKAAVIAKPRAARKVVALRVAAGAQQISGERLNDWFASHDLRFGKYDIYHRYDEHGDTLFSVASMVEPGSFDRASMLDTEYPGVSFFLQLPNAADGTAAFDEMLACAHALQKDFFCSLYGERNAPLTPDLAERMRDGVADFQHLMSTPPTR